MADNYDRSGSGPPPTTTSPYAASGSQYYTASDPYYSTASGQYSMGGQSFQGYGTAPSGPGLGQQHTYSEMTNTPNQPGLTGAPGGGLPPMSTFVQGTQYPPARGPNPYGPPLPTRAPPPTSQAGMIMPSNTPSNSGRGSSSTGTGQAPVLRPSRGGSPIRRKKHHKHGSAPAGTRMGLDSIPAGAGSGQATACTGAPPNPIYGFGPAIPAGRAAPPPQFYAQGSYGQGYGSQQPGNQYLGPRNLGQFHLSTSQSQVGSSNDPPQGNLPPQSRGHSGAQAPQPQKTIKKWTLGDDERLNYILNVEGQSFDHIGEVLGCTGSEARRHHQDLKRKSEAQEAARHRVAALANTSNPVPLVQRYKGGGVKWTRDHAIWMEQRVNALTRAPENRYKQSHEVLEMVAAEINFKNGTMVSQSTVGGTLSKLNAERSGHRMDWG